MTNNRRRTLLNLLGAAATVGGTRTASAKPDSTGSPKKGRIRKLGHSLLSDPGGGYGEEDIRADGQYALVGHFSPPGGSFLVDISDPTDPTPTDQYRTDDKADQTDGAGFVGEPPMAWGAAYSEERDLVVTSDMQTGLYVFKVTPARSK